MTTPTAKHAANERMRYFDHYDYPAASASASYVMSSAELRPIRISRVMICTSATLAANASNYFTIQLFNVTTSAVVAQWTTNTTGTAGGFGTLTGSTPQDLLLSSTAANLDFLVGNVYEFKLALTGAATLPTGRFRVEGYEL